MAFDFARVSTMLAFHHDISISHMTKFFSRLKNLHRLGWPLAFESTKGKASSYSLGDLLDMAMALELLQLGLTPERAILVLKNNRWASLMAYRLAASALAEQPWAFLPEKGEDQTRDIPFSMFIYFDPSGLQDLKEPPADDEWAIDGGERDSAEATFFFGGPGVIERIALGWNSGATRLAICNVSTVIHALAFSRHPVGQEADLEFRSKFYREIGAWAAGQLESLGISDDPEADFIWSLINHVEIRDAQHLADNAQCSLERAQEMLTKWEKGQSDGEHP